MKKTVLSIACALFSMCVLGQLEMNSSGNVAIGASPSSSYKLYMNGNTKLRQGNISMILSGDKVEFYHQNSADKMFYGIKSYEPYLYPDADNSGYLGSTTYTFYQVHGRYVYSNGTYVTSDERLKENIRELQNPLDKILSVRAVKFDYKLDINPKWPETKQKDIVDKSTNRFGFIAQELELVYPELVVYDEESDQYSVDYIGMIPILLEAIKEQQAEIQDLKTNLESVIQGSALKGAPVNVEDDIEDSISECELFQNTPNPFNEETQISLKLSDHISSATLYIYDMNGKQLRGYTLEERGDFGVKILSGELDAGIYLYSLVADGSLIATKQMILTD